MSVRNFFQAIENRDVAAVREMVRGDASLLDARIEDGPDRRVHGFTGLHLAAYVGDEAIERGLVELGTAPDILNTEGRTALHVALEYNNTTRDTLIELGCPVDVCAAASLEKLDLLRGMLEAKPELANDGTTGLPPLGWAAYFCAIDSATLLLDRGARTGTALMCAAEVCCTAVGKLLLDRGADADELHESWGARAIHAAAAMPHSSDSRPFVTLLLDQGADINGRTAKGETALTIAKRLRDRQDGTGSERPKPFAALVELLEARGGVA